MARQREDPRRTAREQVGAFLSAHRGLVSPQQAGLPSGIGHRRVQGLRRDRLGHTSSGWVAPAVASRTQVVVRPELQRVLDLLEPAAAFVRNGRLDVLATNAPGRALYANVMAGRTVDRAPNLAR